MVHGRRAQRISRLLTEKGFAPIPPVSDKKLSVVIPAYNEGPAIAEVLEKLKAALESSGWSHELIVVDDCSSDNTATAAESAGAMVIRHPKNMGYGGALRTGILASTSEWIVTIDADCSYPPVELLKLLPSLPQFDMVVGARQGRHYWGNFVKQPARLLFLAMAQFVVGEKIPDVNSGLRIFRKSIACTMLPRLCRGFSFSTTLTLSFLSSHRFVRFTPVDYAPRVGSSKVRIFRDSLRTLQLLLETIIYYNPIKASLLLGAFPFLLALLGYVVAAITRNAHWFYFSSAMICVFLLLLSQGFILFMLAHTADDHRKE